MDKLSMHSPDLTEQNIVRLAELFPNCVTESAEDDGKLKRVINFDQLRQELSGSIVEGSRERYHLDWPGKKEAVLFAGVPIAKTLRPCRDESVEFDKTKNLFIDGDNLDALKLMQESYLNKIKIIYIDPPYNTGNDLIYDDRFCEAADAYFRRSNQVDEAEHRLVTNPESNGRFHSHWLTMMYPRLKLARNLLRDDGVIFISIDDGEVANLRKICDEIYGADNFLGNIARATGQTTGQDSGGLGSSFDFILAYSKQSDVDLSGLPLTPKDLRRFDGEDERGIFAIDQMRKTGSGDRRTDRPNMFYAVADPDGGEVLPIAPAGYEGRWRFERKTYENAVAEGLILWKKTKRGDSEIWWPYVKYYAEGRTKRPSPLWNDLDGNKKAARDLRELFDGAKVFDFPKPVSLIERCIQIAPNAASDDIVLDFFAGSATTAHAVMSLNAKDGGDRTFIVVQAAETCEEGSEARANGYHTIADLAKERIRRAGTKVKADCVAFSENLDVGFRVLKVAASNMKDVYYAPDGVKQGDLLDQIENIKDDRTPEDLLFQVLLDWGVDLSHPIEEETIEGKTVFFVDENSLAACFDEEINEELVKTIAVRKPLRVVFRDSGYGNDSVKINVEQIFKLISPSTEVKSI